MAGVCIACPAPRGSHKGNRVTAERWAMLLRRIGHSVVIAEEWRGQRCDVLIALHARKSAASIARFRREYPEGALVVALTGTDLYRDLALRPATRRSLDLASRVVALQPSALHELVGSVSAKTRVIYQSAVPPAAHVPLRATAFEVCVVGHLRAVKDPWRASLAARTLPGSSRVRVLHAGAAPTPAIARRARTEERKNPRYKWLGDLSRGQVLKVIARSRLLVLSSRMEGGANVVSEAVVAGTPILASRIPGSVGLLGEDYPGFFEAGDTNGLAALLHRAETEPAFLEELAARCARLAPLFAPERERAAWETLLDELLDRRPPCRPGSIADRLRVTSAPVAVRETLAREIREGLTASPKSLPCKLFYDDRGSKLFDEICDLPEYYPTRTEQALLDRHAGDIAAKVAPKHLVELGPGMARKTRTLLEACAGDGRELRYLALDISEDTMREAATRLLADYPGLRIDAIVTDYDRGIPKLPALQADERRLACFLGGTIGNYGTEKAIALLRRLNARLGPDDWFLLGTDLVKDRGVLEAAYNDAAGVTAEFNRNALRHLNRLFGADFRPELFDHAAIWNDAEAQIEMYLTARRAQRVRIPALELEVHVADGEAICTEISRKFTRPVVTALLAASGFALEDWLTPPDEAFALALARRMA